MNIFLFNCLSLTCLFPLAVEYCELNMKTCTYFVLIFIISTIEGNRWRCDYDYLKQANGYFKYHEFPANWHDARFRCQLEGAVLASPYPKDVQDALLGLMTHQQRKRTIFTGIHATFSKGDYHTINGTPISKIPVKWMISEPDNKNDAESCITLTSQGLASDAKCSDTYPYFCYHERTDDVLFMDLCGSSDRAYQYSEQTHSCYKFHTVPASWSRAHMACSAEGGHLLIINSHVEAEFIKQLYAKYPDNTMIGNFRKDLAFIGFYDWTEHGDWRTIHGQTLKDAGYDVFEGGEPNNGTAGEYCGSVQRTGRLNDLWCDKQFPFICEKKPNSLVCEEESAILDDE